MLRTTLATATATTKPARLARIAIDQSLTQVGVRRRTVTCAVGRPAAGSSGMKAFIAWNRTTLQRESSRPRPPDRRFFGSVAARPSRLAPKMTDLEGGSGGARADPTQRPSPAEGRGRRRRFAAALQGIEACAMVMALAVAGGTLASAYGDAQADPRT